MHNQEVHSLRFYSHEDQETPVLPASDSAGPVIFSGESPFRLILENTSDTIWIVDLATSRFTYVSPSIYRLRGYRPEEILGQTMQDVLTPESYQYVSAGFPARLASFLAGDVEAGYGISEVDQYHKDGSLVHTEVSTTFLTDEAGQPTAVLGVSRNITERKQAQAALQQRNRELADLNAIVTSITSSLALEDVLKSILGSLPNFFPKLYGASVHLVDESKAFLRTCTVTENSSQSDDPLYFEPGQGIAGWVFQERKPLNVADIAAEPRFMPALFPAEFRSLLGVPLIFQDQALGALCITARPVGAFSGQDVALLEGLAGYAAIAVQNARLYEQTRRDAEAKQILLKEVNHRVKNNLVAILSLLTVEKYAIRADGSAKSAPQLIDDLGERIQGLLVVHEQLSASQWAPLPVEHLIRETVQSALSGCPIRGEIKLVIACPAAAGPLVAPNKATDLALALNELATNSVKYAFPGRTTGRIEIEISFIPGQPDLHLIYRDDGPGFPEEVLQGKRENTGLGLIRSAARNHLELSNDGGAIALLTLPGVLVAKTK
jgi:PAS domain S-box-containing protein